jgi:hypothetical protein
MSEPIAKPVPGTESVVANVPTAVRQSVLPAHKPEGIEVTMARRSVVFPLESKTAGWLVVVEPVSSCAVALFPLIPVICVPLILKTLPVAAVSNVLFESVSVVPLPM